MVKKEFEAYIEDLVLFGANAIELLPPKTDDRLYSALFPEDPMELMCEVSKSFIPMAWTSGCGIRMSDAIIMILGASTRRWKNAGGSFLQFLIWMQCWVPAGGSRSLWPTDAMRLTEHFVEILHEYHPEAGVWVAPQHFQPEPGWYDTFMKKSQRSRTGFAGVCFAPWGAGQHRRAV